MKDPLVSVVIPVGQDAECFGRCLDRVLRQDYPKTEVIVVCDPRAEEVACLPEGSEDLRVIRERQPSEPGQLMNAGLCAARGHVKILLAPCCVPVGTGWIRSMVQPFEDDAVGVVVSQCLAADRAEPGLASRLLDSVDPPQRRSAAPGPEPQQTVSHLCDAYRASLLADIGYFESNGLSGRGQAIDASVKVADAGYSILLSDAAAVHYHAPQSRRRLARAMLRALDYGRWDAALDRLYELRWLNAGLFAAALASLLLLPVGALSLPAAVVMSVALFVWAAFLSLRTPVLGWEWPLAGVNFAAFVVLVLAVRRDWWPGLFGRDVHPAVIRQWFWLAAITGSDMLLVAWAAARGACRCARQRRGLPYALPVLILGLGWWLLAGIGYVTGRCFAPSARG